jgi:hypothetical protein
MSQLEESEFPKEFLDIIEGVKRAFLLGCILHRICGLSSNENVTNQAIANSANRLVDLAMKGTRKDNGGS